MLDRNTIIHAHDTLTDYSLTEADLNDEEIATLQTLAEKCVQKWNLERPIKSAGVNRKERKLDDYYRQYPFGYVDTMDPA